VAVVVEGPVLSGLPQVLPMSAAPEGTGRHRLDSARSGLQGCSPVAAVAVV
jgi:hypothetical protein